MATGRPIIELPLPWPSYFELVRTARPPGPGGRGRGARDSGSEQSSAGQVCNDPGVK